MSVSKEFLSLLGSSLRSDLEKTMERISKTFDWDAATEIYEGKNIMNIVERLRERSSVALSEEDVTHFNQAADEIERLQNVNKAQAKWLYDEQQAHKALRDKVRQWLRDDKPDILKESE